MINEAFEWSKQFFNTDYNYKVPVETVAENTMHYYRFDDEDGFLSYMFAKGKKDYFRFCANVIYVEAKSDDLLIHTLVDEVNKLYESIENIQPDTSVY